MRQLWDMLENRNLFSAFAAPNVPDDLRHMAQIIGLLGPPPADIISQLRSSNRFFDKKGELARHCFFLFDLPATWHHFRGLDSATQHRSTPEADHATRTMETPLLTSHSQHFV